MPTKEAQRFNVTKYGEGRTGNGQIVMFSAIPDKVDTVKDALANVQSLHLPESHKVNIAQGGRGSYSRYDIQQHKYAGSNGEDGHGGFMEVLEIKDAPEGRHPVVIYEYSTRWGSDFAEFATVQEAKVCFKKKGCWLRQTSLEELSKYPGFMRKVNCGDLEPWFYAIGNQELIGDYALPEDVQDDPVYRIGQKFVVTDRDEVQRIKTCLGTRFVDYTEHEPVWPSGERSKRVLQRVVYWDDGSVSQVDLDKKINAVPLVEGQMWITEANEKFKELLAGEISSFTIHFADGSKFVGKVIPAKENPHFTPAGRYRVQATLADGRSAGDTINFVPTDEFPTVEKYVMTKAKVPSPIIKITAQLLEKDRKWKGVFYNPQAPKQ